MPQLAVAVEFLDEFAKLQPPIRRRTIDALGRFSAHTHAGLHLERLAGMRDDRVRTIRITDYWRGVVLAPTSGDRYLLLRVLGHDEAAEWASRRTFSVNEVSGVLEVRDVASLEALAGTTLPEPTAVAPLFNGFGASDLRKLGIDDQVLSVARTLADEAALDAVAPFLPENQAEVLYALASGMTVDQAWADVVAPRVPDEPVDPTDLGAAVARTQGRIALVDGPDELLALFEKPMALWRVFLHPTQEEVAYRRSYWGSAQVTGGPGTGKTVVALHRVKHLAGNRELPPKSILLTTFTRGLAEALDRDIAQLLDPELRRVVEVLNVDRWAIGVVRAEHGTVAIATEQQLRERIQQAAAADTPFTPSFLLEEWRQVVLAGDVHSGDAYVTATRRGRGRGLTKGQKRAVWSVLDRFQTELRTDGMWTWLTIADEAARLVAARETPPFRHVVVDEIQDLHPAQWRLLRAAVRRGPDDLFLTGDPHQRIYGNHVSLRQVGISVAGRSSRLRINYRTSAEILQWAMGVLGDIAIADLDEGLDSLAGYRSALRGAPPDLVPATSAAQEAEELALALQLWHDDDGVAWNDMAVVARTTRVTRRLARELGHHDVRTAELGAADPPADAVRLGTMHGLKGLEFRCVAVAGVGRDTLPLPAAVTPAAEDPIRHALDVQQERCLLFVACTRARERLRVSWSGPASELLPAALTQR